MGLKRIGLGADRPEDTPLVVVHSLIHSLRPTIQELIPS